ncbi:MAG: hypothetical protein JW993_04815 [Sedimentisphaerales bacterium]|nr:hypothetical protein [Sedimentisphaerales bacterium]
MLARTCVLVAICTLVCSSLAAAAAPAVHPATGEPLVVTCLRGTPAAIDGDLSDWNLDAMTPAVLDVAEQINSGATSWDGPDDLSGKFYLLWDDQNIYIAVVVKDDLLSATKAGSNIWNADCVEIFFATTDAVPTASAPSTIHYQYGFNANAQKWNWCNMDGSTDVEPDYLQVAAGRTPDGYICEASIAYGHMLSLDSTAGNTLGFHPVLDDTEATDREIQMTWTSREAHDQSLGYGHVILSPERAVARELAHSPKPAQDAVDVPVDTIPSWSPGEFAVSHDVYFGTVFDDVNNATRNAPLGLLVGQGQQATTYEPPSRLQYGQTYYWRIDEVNAPPDSTIHKGAVWSFTTEPLLHPVANIVASASIPAADGSGDPQATVDGSGLVDGQHSRQDAAMWLGDGSGGGPVWIQFDFDRLYKVYQLHVWNYNGLYETALGFGCKDVTIEYAAEPDQWVSLGDFQLSRATSKATYAGQMIDIGGLPMRSLRINVASNFGGFASYGLSEVQFLHKPTFARQPQPADGAEEVDPATVLSWRPGREAVTHELQFGTDEAAVAAGTALVDTITASSYDPGALNLGTRYYWRVEEVNDTETPSIWSSALWSFTTQEYVAIDDFESYSDDEGNLIYETWTDGYEITANGSQVGHDNPPYAEKSIVHTGRQAMPLYYNNTGAAAYSEAELAFASPQDLSANSADVLSLYYRGVPTGFYETPSGTILMNGTGADIVDTTDQFRFAYKQLTGSGSITVRVDRIDNTHEWAKAGVMIRSGLTTVPLQAHMIVTPPARTEWQYRPTASAGTTQADTGVDTTPFPYWVRLTRQGNTITGERSADGQTWLPLTAGDPASSRVDLVLPEPVYIGLVVCSHVANTPAGAEFSHVAVTGTVSAGWQLAAIGADQVPGNGIDRFYLALEDSAGKKATFANPSATAVATASWQQWTIPVSDIAAAGVNAPRITKLQLGVGDSSQPTKNVSGLLYIDDVAFGRPLSADGQ